MQSPAPGGSRWIDALDDEDLTFIQRFILASGSLKELARIYGVSYPTLRLRLDRLIAKVEVLAKNEPSDPYERLLRAEHAAGRLDRDTLGRLLDGYRKQSSSG
jgi:hypothetical protein